jgi:hypothetical protein
MKKTVSFSWLGWIRDARIRRLSFADRGMLMDILAHIDRNPNVVLSGRSLAKELGTDHRTVSRSLNRLEANGIFDRDGADALVLLPITDYSQPSRPPAHEWAQLRALVFSRDNYTCGYCGSRGGKLECDHVIAVSRHGSHDIENLITSCFDCNRGKGSKTVEEWRLAP